jgi:hypothetical protein
LFLGRLNSFVLSGGFGDPAARAGLGPRRLRASKKN